MGAPVEMKSSKFMSGIAGRTPYSRTNIVIQINEKQSEAEIDFTIGHEIAHLMTCHRRQLATGNFWADAAWLATKPELYALNEALCDYTSARMLGYISIGDSHNI